VALPRARLPLFRMTLPVKVLAAFRATTPSPPWLIVRPPVPPMAPLKVRLPLPTPPIVVVPVVGARVMLPPVLLNVARLGPPMLMNGLVPVRLKLLPVPLAIVSVPLAKLLRLKLLRLRTPALSLVAVTVLPSKLWNNREKPDAPPAAGAPGGVCHAAALV